MALLDLLREDTFIPNLPKDVKATHRALALNIKIFYKQRSNSMCLINLQELEDISVVFSKCDLLIVYQNCLLVGDKNAYSLACCRILN